METINMRLRQAIAAAKAGKESQARVLAQYVLTEEPENVHALLLLSTMAESSEQQVEYLSQVLAINPEHAGARKRLARLSPHTLEMIAEQSQGEAEIDEAEAIFEESVDMGETPLDDAESEPVPLADTVAVPTPVVYDDEMEEEVTATQADTMISATPVASRDEFASVESGGFPESIEGDDLADPEEQSRSGLELEEAVPELTGQDPDEDEEEDPGEIPDWLREEGGYATHEGMSLESPTSDSQPEDEGQALPEWLQEKPGDSWLEDEDPELERTAEIVYEIDDTPSKTTSASERWSTDSLAEPAIETKREQGKRGEETIQPDAYGPPLRATKRGSRISTRTLEIFLAALIIVALLVVTALIFVIINAPR